MNKPEKMTKTMGGHAADQATIDELRRLGYTVQVTGLRKPHCGRCVACKGSGRGAVLADQPANNQPICGTCGGSGDGVPSPDQAPRYWIKANVNGNRLRGIQKTMGYVEMGR